MYTRASRVWRSEKPACRNTERWRTADACYGTRTDVKAEDHLMDEPSMGLSPILVEEIFHIIREISASGTTVLLVEQNAKKHLRSQIVPMY